MKRFIIAFAIVMTVLTVGFSASAATPRKTQSNLVENIWKSLPETLVVKQEATLHNGQTVTVYYKKSGDRCEVYSADKVAHLTVDDLASVKESNFDITTSVKGQLLFSAPFSKVRRMVKQAVNTYL